VPASTTTDESANKCDVGLDLLARCLRFRREERRCWVDRDDRFLHRCHPLYKERWWTDNSASAPLAASSTWHLRCAFITDYHSHGASSAGAWMMSSDAGSMFSMLDDAESMFWMLHRRGARPRPRSNMGIRD
jgi:hypothetical protein